MGAGILRRGGLPARLRTYQQEGKESSGMNGMLHRYATWTRKQASTAQCSPALAAAGIVVVMGIVIYVYRQVIMTTIIDAVLAAVGVALFVGAVALTLSTIRWYRRKAAEERARMAAPRTYEVPEPTDDAG